MMGSPTPLTTPPVPFESKSESLDQMMNRATSLVIGTESLDKEVNEQFEETTPQTNSKHDCEDIALFCCNLCEIISKCIFCFQ